MNEWLRAWQEADAVTLFFGSLHVWSDERARGYYLRAMIPSYEDSAK